MLVKPITVAHYDKILMLQKQSHGKVDNKQQLLSENR